MRTTMLGLRMLVGATALIVLGACLPAAWATDIGRPYPGTSNGARWV